MTTITIKTVKRASGYQARYEMTGCAPVRCTGYASPDEAVEAAKAAIKRVMDTRVPGMDSITIDVVSGR